MFGCELETLCEREGSNVPRFLVRFMEHIEKEGLDVVGIYRLSGNAASVTKLRYQVDQGMVMSLYNSVSKYKYAHVLIIMISICNKPVLETCTWTVHSSVSTYCLSVCMNVTVKYMKLYVHVQCSQVCSIQKIMIVMCVY